MSTTFLNYWHWFFYGSGDRPGYTRILNKWIMVHLVVGVVLSLLVQITLESSASTVLFPLAGIFVALTFAWAGNTMALMQSQEMKELAKHRPGGFAEYVFTYQTAILVILVTLVLWGLAGLKIYDMAWPGSKAKILYFMVKAFLFSLSSLTLRECWHVVMGAQWMLLVQREIKDRMEQGKKNE